MTSALASQHETCRYCRTSVLRFLTISIRSSVLMPELRYDDGRLIVAEASSVASARARFR